MHASARITPTGSAPPSFSARHADRNALVGLLGASGVDVAAARAVASCEGAGVQAGSTGRQSRLASLQQWYDSGVSGRTAADSAFAEESDFFLREDEHAQVGAGPVRAVGASAAAAHTGGQAAAKAAAAGAGGGRRYRRKGGARSPSPPAASSSSDGTMQTDADAGTGSGTGTGTGADRGDAPGVGLASSSTGRSSIDARGRRMSNDRNVGLGHGHGHGMGLVGVAESKRRSPSASRSRSSSQASRTSASSSVSTRASVSTSSSSASESSATSHRRSSRHAQLQATAPNASTSFVSTGRSTMTALPPSHSWSLLPAAPTAPAAACGAAFAAAAHGASASTTAGTAMGTMGTTCGSGASASTIAGTAMGTTGTTCGSGVFRRDLGAEALARRLRGLCLHPDVSLVDVGARMEARAHDTPSAPHTQSQFQSGSGSAASAPHTRPFDAGVGGTTSDSSSHSYAATSSALYVRSKLGVAGLTASPAAPPASAHASATASPAAADDDSSAWPLLPQFAASASSSSASAGAAPPQPYPTAASAAVASFDISSLPATDAVLSCPGCFTVICRLCQVHKHLPGHFRAADAENVIVKRQLRAQVSHSAAAAAVGAGSSAAAAVGAASSDSSTSPLLHPVACAVCSCELGVYEPLRQVDEHADSEGGLGLDGIYHFSHVIDGDG